MKQEYSSSDANSAAKACLGVLLPAPPPSPSSQAIQAEAREAIAMTAVACSRPVEPSAALWANLENTLFANNNPRKPKLLHFTRILAVSGWAAAAAVAGVFWLAWPDAAHLQKVLALQTEEAKRAQELARETATTNADPAEGSNALQVVPEPRPSPKAGSRVLVQSLPGKAETVTLLRQDFDKLQRDLGKLRATQDASLVQDPRVARPTIVELTDPKKPAKGTDAKRSLGDLISDGLGGELEKATKGKKPKEDSDAKPAPTTDTEPPKPTAVYFDRTAPHMGEFALPPGVIEIGGGYFFDANRNLIMEPNGDGRTFTLREPGPDFDPNKTRLAPVADLSKKYPDKKPEPFSAPEPLPEPEPEPELVQVPESEAVAPYVNDGFAWVDQTNGQGSLVLPPGLPAPTAEQSYWLWMTVPGRADPVAIGTVQDFPTDGGRVDFSLRERGLIPESFLLTREGPGVPAKPSENIALRGP